MSVLAEASLDARRTPALAEAIAQRATLEFATAAGVGIQALLLKRGQKPKCALPASVSYTENNTMHELDDRMIHTQGDLLFKRRKDQKAVPEGESRKGFRLI